MHCLPRCFELQKKTKTNIGKIFDPIQASEELLFFLLTRHTNEYAFLSDFANVGVVSSMAAISGGHFLSFFSRAKKQCE